MFTAIAGYYISLHGSYTLILQCEMRSESTYDSQISFLHTSGNKKSE